MTSAGWFGHYVTHTDTVPASHVILAAVVAAPVVAAWLWRHWNG